jgi:hypothetical protein
VEDIYTKTRLHPTTHLTEAHYCLAGYVAASTRIGAVVADVVVLAAVHVTTSVPTGTGKLWLHWSRRGDGDGDRYGYDYGRY